MEMNMAKFSEKLGELMELAKKKKNVLEYQEISDFFKDFPLEPEQSAYRIQGGIIYNECTGRKLRKKHGEAYNRSFCRRI